MNTIKYYIMTLATIIMSSCMDGGYGDVDVSIDPFANNDIKETNVITIKELKDMYQSVMSGTKGTYVTDDVQIKGSITGNDIEGNLYNEIVIQDETGAIGIEIERGGMFGIYSEGTEILVNVKDLYIGCYRNQPQLGALYTNTTKGDIYPSRMPFTVWKKHYKTTGQYKKYEPKVFGDGSTKSLTWTADDAGVLGVIKNVSFNKYFNVSQLSDNPISENSTYADAINGSNYSWYTTEFGDNLQLFNSGYSDFAAKKIPHGKVDLIGICKNYNGKCEVVLRSIKDVIEH